MTVPPKIVELVELFGRDLALYKRAGYKETRVRVEFIVYASRPGQSQRTPRVGRLSVQTLVGPPNVARENS